MSSPPTVTITADATPKPISAPSERLQGRRPGAERARAQHRERGEHHPEGVLDRRSSSPRAPRARARARRARRCGSRTERSVAVGTQHGPCDSATATWAAERDAHRVVPGVVSGVVAICTAASAEPPQRERRGEPVDRRGSRLAGRAAPRRPAFERVDVRAARAACMASTSHCDIEGAGQDLRAMCRATSATPRDERRVLGRSGRRRRTARPRSSRSSSADQASGRRSGARPARARG